MDWLQGLNDVVEYMEGNLTEEIKYEVLAKMVCCSVYEFTRIFSFMAGVSVSEYIRRRRLSQAVFDIQNGEEKIIDIALKYGYESQAAFSRAFKEIHNETPIAARRNGVSLKTYPKISFKLTIKGVHEMKFRIETKDSFKIMGLKGYSMEHYEGDDLLDPIWRTFMDNYNSRLWNGGGKNNYYKPPFWQVGAYKYESVDGKTECIIGAELRDTPVIEGMDIDIVPAATWAVFTITSPTGFPYVSEAHARIATEWFPASSYKRNEKVQLLEVFGPGDANSPSYEWETWVPVLSK